MEIVFMSTNCRTWTKGTELPYINFLFYVWFMYPCFSLFASLLRMECFLVWNVNKWNHFSILIWFFWGMNYFVLSLLRYLFWVWVFIIVDGIHFNYESFLLGVFLLFVLMNMILIILRVFVTSIFGYVFQTLKAYGLQKHQSCHDFVDV